MKACIFDFFNVIATPGYWPIITAHFPKENQGYWSDLLSQVDLGVMKDTEFIEMLELATKTPSQDLYAQSLTNVSLDQAVLSIIAELRSNGIKTALLTNSSREFLSRVFQKEKMLDTFFDVVIASSEMKSVKPNKEGYVKTISLLNEPVQDIVFIDDDPVNVQTAVALGMTGIVFQDAQKLRDDLKDI